MDVELKPRLRGVFHQYAFYVAVVAGVVLVALSDSGRELVATWIYAAALAAMFGVSALYHRVNWRSTRVRTWMRRLDHSTILLLIAGTYTPFALLAFDGRIGDVILVVVWCGAAAGLVLNLAWVDAPKWLTALVFIALGWVGVAAVPELLDLGVAPTVLVFVGGGLYTLGALDLRAPEAESRPGDVRLPRDLPRPRDRGGRRALHRDRGLCPAGGVSYRIRMEMKTQKTDEQWRAELSPEQYEILRRKGTERAFTGKYNDTKDPGVYRCAGCGAELFRSEAKFDSGSGWPSFVEPASLDSVVTETDSSYGMIRTEVMCASCGGHLGHVFPDGPARPDSASASTRARSSWSARERRDRDRDLRGGLLLGRRGRVPEHARRHRAKVGYIGGRPRTRPTRTSAAAARAMPRASR